MILTTNKINKDSLNRSTDFRVEVLKNSKKIYEGGYLIDDDIYLKILNQYPIQEQLGLGDLVSFVATPIAKALKMSCIDPATKQLRPESPCAKRKAKLNKIKLGLNKAD